ncbi:MAG: FHA domain-containing protein [Planctomycetes bacterium]|nr:FHA domain-containing protein [Planctomycetota bacterium]
MASLFVIRGNDQGARFELEDTAVRLGRDASNPVRLHDTEVSRQHAEIRLADDARSLCDLGSSNGTFVNGKRVRQHPLASGDQVQVGSTLMLYTEPGDESPEDLSAKISIATKESGNDESHIIYSLSQEEGSRIFDFDHGGSQTSWLARARGNLQVMYRTALAVSHTLDIDQLLNRIMELIFEWIEADRGCIMLVDPTTKLLEPKARRTRKGIGSDDKITISKSILDYVVDRNEGVMTTNAREDDRFDGAGSILQMGIREAICAPMRGRYEVVGVIYVDTFTSPQKVIQQGGASQFKDDHLKLMIAIAHQAALAVEDTRHYSAMVQAERLAAIGQTIATLSHHTKNILQGIRGGSYLIDMGLSEHDEKLIRKGWSIVDKNQAKISALVLDMLTFSKDREPDLQEAQLNTVVADVIELMQGRAKELDVALRWEADESIPSLMFDPEGLHRAVLNVVTNAIDAACETKQDGHVEVRTEYLPAESKALVVVRDNGGGIGPQELDRVFRPFVSFKGGRGTGLGLPVSQKILNEHGGRIAVESTPDKGSCFTLELPVVKPNVSGQTSPG